MNNKGQTMNQIGMFIGIFTIVIVGIALFQSSAQQIGQIQDLTTIENQSLSAAAENNVPQYLTNMRSISDVNIFNATNDVEIPDDNYTVTNNNIDPTTGGLAVNITPNSPAPELGYNVGIWTIDGTAQPTTYVPEASTRSIAGLIIIFFGLAVAVVALVPTLRSQVLKMVGK